MDGSLVDTNELVDVGSLNPFTAEQTGAWTREGVGRMPTTAWIPIESLYVNPLYQRTIGDRGAKLIKSMVERWQWPLCGMIVVVKLADGRYEVLDGQHRCVGAAAHGGIRSLPAVVIECQTLEERARVFVTLNSSRVSTTPSQRFRAAIASREREAVAIDRIAGKAGVRILPNPPYKNEFSVGDTLAASSLLKAYRTWGDEVLRRVLAFCVEARLAPIKADHLSGLGTLFGEEPWKGSHIDMRALVRALEQWEAVSDRAEVARLDGGITKAVALATELYRRAGSDGARRCA